MPLPMPVASSGSRFGAEDQHDDEEDDENLREA
jgi:hypothetical protein